jgi:hypothetical protein
MYDGLATVSANFDLLSHAAQIKSWDALESNGMTRKYFFSLRDILDCGVVDTDVSQCWGPKLSSWLNYH